MGNDTALAAGELRGDGPVKFGLEVGLSDGVDALNAPGGSFTLFGRSPLTTESFTSDGGAVERGDTGPVAAAEAAVALVFGLEEAGEPGRRSGCGSFTLMRFILLITSAFSANVFSSFGTL